VVDRDEHGRFIKGHEKVAGRQLGLQMRAQAATHDGADLITFYLDVFHGALTQLVIPDEGEPKMMPTLVKLEHRMEAAAWLADRGWGKPTQPTELLGQDGQSVVFTVKWGDDTTPPKDPSPA
jgi:hypothetical protein